MAGRAEQRVRVADVASLRHGQARTFTFDDDGHEGRGFVLVLREGEGEDDDVRVVAYRNRCAHVAFDLDMGTGEFWSSKLGRIYCRTHGACYEPLTGRCDRGPCVGAHLEAFEVDRDGPDAIVRIAASPSPTP